MLASGMFWVEGPEENGARDTVCEFRNASFDKTIDVERDSSHRNRFVTAWDSSDESLTGGRSLSRIRVWLEKLQPEIGKLPVELSRQPWA